ncbi:hypothetical protein [Vibrio agarivorans]|uniref:Uncharacterized protein n=1 Tax=Vibrio agarivorans TaxID=153622 RepID=A0ABT7Y738_9VIBR|nr:hypothetical protein [Vibrio agarivorans]MDN2483867.1 hypothetical protein [Vibrio agarivorans]
MSKNSGVPPYWVQKLVLNAVSMVGTCDPDELIHILEEEFTPEQWDVLSGFLSHLHSNQLTIGSGNFESRYAQWQEGGN